MTAGWRAKAEEERKGAEEGAFPEIWLTTLAGPSYTDSLSPSKAEAAREAIFRACPLPAVRRPAGAEEGRPASPRRRNGDFLPMLSFRPKWMVCEPGIRRR